MKANKQYWIKNITSNDLLLSDLNIRIPSNMEVNIFILNPTITKEQIIRSEQQGSLKKCYSNKKICPVITSNNSIKDKYNIYQIKEATTSIPSRVKTAVIVDARQSDHIEELSVAFDKENAARFESYIDGFSDPIADRPAELTPKEQIVEMPIAQAEGRYRPTAVIKQIKLIR